MKLGILLGSLRRESFSRKIAENVAKLLPESVEVEWLPIDMPMYNPDLDDDGAPPAVWAEFRLKIKECDAFLFVTPEYNRSIPPVIKNALDIGSRPYGQNAWGGRKGAVISISAGALGGFGANHTLRQAVVFLDVTMMQQPEIYLGNVAGLLDENGRVSGETAVLLEEFADAFMAFI